MFLGIKTKTVKSLYKTWNTKIPQLYVLKLGFTVSSLEISKYLKTLIKTYKEFFRTWSQEVGVTQGSFNPNLKSLYLNSVLRVRDHVYIHTTFLIRYDVLSDI